MQGNLRRLFAVRTGLTNYKIVSDPFPAIYRSDLKVDFDKKCAIWRKGDNSRYSPKQECNAKSRLAFGERQLSTRSRKDGF